jgi:hypothetical protein
MGVRLSIIGKHKIPFKNREIQDIQVLFNLLISLKLEKSNFLNEMFITWYTSDNFSEEEIHNNLKIASETKRSNSLFWQIQDIYENYCSESLHYCIKGPYGLTLELNQYYFNIDILINSYYNWFTLQTEDDFQWRENWRLIVCKIAKAFGGSFVLYFPDSLVDLSFFWPCNYCFPNEMADVLRCSINDLDQLIEVISENYSKPMSLRQADKLFCNMGKEPFVIDRFDDLVIMKGDD